MLGAKGGGRKEYLAFMPNISKFASSNKLKITPSLAYPKPFTKSRGRCENYFCLFFLFDVNERG